MSSINAIIPISNFANDEKEISNHEESYLNLINYCSLIKQIYRVIPSYYINYQKKLFTPFKNSTYNQEELSKIQEEIFTLEKSIKTLNEQKQKKLHQIEELRYLMKEMANKKVQEKNKGNTKELNLPKERAEASCSQPGSNLSSDKNGDSRCEEEIVNCDFNSNCNNNFNNQGFNTSLNRERGRHLRDGEVEK